jgi:hypothetical protein
MFACATSVFDNPASSVQGIPNTTLQGAWSVARRIVPTYAGSLIRVRRVSDDAEQNIGFDGSGNLDTTSLLSFVGSSTGYVKTIYDQAGICDFAEGTTPALQPPIVKYGQVFTLNGKPAACFHYDSSTNHLTRSVANFTNGVDKDFAYLTVGRSPLSIGGNTGTDFGAHLDVIDTFNVRLTVPTAATESSSPTFSALAGQRTAISVYGGSSATTLYTRQNGVVVDPGTLKARSRYNTPTTAPYMYIGTIAPYTGGIYYPAPLSELIIVSTATGAPSLNMSDVFFIEADQLSYYGLPAATTSGWSPWNKSLAISLSNSNRTANYAAGASGNMCVRGINAIPYTSNGYFEVRIDGTGTEYLIGIVTESVIAAGAPGFGGADSCSYYAMNGAKYRNGAGAGYGATFTTGDIIGVAYKNGKIWVSKNNAWQSGDPATDTSPMYSGIVGDYSAGLIYPAASLSGSTYQVTGRFKTADFSYSPPSGFSAWEP